MTDWEEFLTDIDKTRKEALSIDEIVGMGLRNLTYIIFIEAKGQILVNGGPRRDFEVVDDRIRMSLIHHIQEGSSLVALGRGRNGPAVHWRKS